MKREKGRLRIRTTYEGLMKANKQYDFQYYQHCTLFKKYLKDNYGKQYKFSILFTIKVLDDNLVNQIDIIITRHNNKTA